jgi:hypothetical protein
VDSDYIDFYRSLINHPYVIAIPMSESLENIKSMISREINKYTHKEQIKRKANTKGKKYFVFNLLAGATKK